MAGQEASLDRLGHAGVRIVSHWEIRRRADRDIDEQLVYLGKQSHRVASRFLDAVEQTFQLLAESPDRGFLWDHDTNIDRNIHVWPIRGFPNMLAFYRPIDQGVEIIRVLHGARDIATLMENEH